MKISVEQLEEAFRRMHVAPGEAVLVHASFKSMGGVENGPKGFIDALLLTVGEQGTVLLPTYKFVSLT